MTLVTGPQLRLALHLMSTYVSFATIAAMNGPGPGDRLGRRGGSGGSGRHGGGTGSTTRAPAPQRRGRARPTTHTTTTGSGTTTTGGAPSGGSIARRSGHAAPTGNATVFALHGTVFPVARGAKVQVKRLTAGASKRVASAGVSAAGAFSAALPAAGRYEVVFQGIVGPTVIVTAHR